MTLELWILMTAAGLGLVHLSVASFAFKAQVGNEYTIGARDENLQPSGVAARLYRAQANFLETFVVFAAFVLVAHVSDAKGGYSEWGAVMYIIGRCLFLPLYALGVRWLRTFSWNLATLGLVLVGVQVFVAHG